MSRWTENPEVTVRLRMVPQKKNSMDENVKPTFEEKLEGWKNRMTLARTVARIIAVIAQIVITYFLLSR